MQPSVPTKRPTGPRARLLTAAALLSGVLVAGCGGSSPSPTGGASTSASAAGAVESGVAFARCIRSHRVPGVPDPSTSLPSHSAGSSAILGGGGYFLAIPKSIDTRSPAFEHAAAACKLR
jgi:hypothetical protein